MDDELDHNGIVGVRGSTPLGSTTDARDAVRDGDRGQVGAFSEGLKLNASDPGRDGNRS